ncbi:Hypothetical_protein [Hexamita inflata]|uniref:Hypothetical_protein n=1 Tax=Hexamita inflata TaxID=28002 RepID=A0ABP1HAF6_9EUKA
MVLDLNSKHLYRALCSTRDSGNTQQVECMHFRFFQQGQLKNSEQILQVDYLTQRLSSTLLKETLWKQLMKLAPITLQIGKHKFISLYSVYNKYLFYKKQCILSVCYKPSV